MEELCMNVIACERKGNRERERGRERGGGGIERVREGTHS